MKSKLFATTQQPIAVDVVLLLTRLICGYAFILIGSGKIQSPLNWMGDQSSVPAVLQALAAISEFVGGMALILGIITRLAAFGIACTMVGATIMHSFVMGDPFVSMTGGGDYQLPIMYLLIMLVFLTIGPGRFSLDRKIFGIRE